MTWDKPKSGQGWLLLFAPAGCCVVATALGGLVDRKDGNWVAWALAGLAIATISSVALSVWLARVNTTAGARLGAAILCFLILMTVNGAVSFAGCAAGFAVLPGLRFM